MQIEHPLVLLEGAAMGVEELVFDEQTDAHAVRDRDDRLAVLRLAEAALAVVEPIALVEPVQVRAGRCARLALVEVPAKSQGPVRRGEHRLALSEEAQIQEVSRTTHGSAG